jgi:hypothetical protein
MSGRLINSLVAQLDSAIKAVILAARSVCPARGDNEVGARRGWQHSEHH